VGVAVPPPLRVYVQGLRPQVDPALLGAGERAEISGGTLQTGGLTDPRCQGFGVGFEDTVEETLQVAP
jgi:hypothetical protein